MALTFVSITISNPKDAKKRIEKRLLVDSGAVYSAIPAEVLQVLGVRPIDKQKFILGNGEVIEKEIGEARFSFQGKERTAPVIFGDKDVYLLGATTLENLGLILDPLRRELKPLPMLLM